MRWVPRLVATLVSSVAKNEIGWFLSTDATAARMIACSAGGIAGRARDDVHAGPPELPHRVVDLVRHRRVETVGLDVADHADDLAFDLGVAATHQDLADRRLAGEDVPGERLVDDDDVGRALAVLGPERPSFGEADPHQPEVVLADDLETGERPLRQRQDVPAADAVRRPRVARQRQADRGGGVADRGIGAQPFDDLVEELRLLRVGLVARRAARRRTRPPRPPARTRAACAAA